MKKQFPEALKKLFLENLKKRNYSPKTLIKYQNDLNKFLEYLHIKRIRDITSVTTDTILDYRQYLESHRKYNGKPYAETTKISLIRSLIHFFRFLKGKGYILLDPMESFPAIKKPKSLPRVIMTKKEVEHLLKQPDIKKPCGYRDRTIMEVLYSTGIRRQELIDLTTYDLDFFTGLLRVNQGKGKKDRVVPIGKIAVSFVKRYIQEIRPIFLKKTNTQILFLTLSGRPLPYATLGCIIYEHVKKAGFKKQITCHTFRHTCATEMLKGGCSIRYVQEMLGHADINSTQIYTKVLPLDLKRVHQRTHPREQLKENIFSPFNCSLKPLRYFTKAKKK